MKAIGTDPQPSKLLSAWPCAVSLVLVAILERVRMSIIDSAAMMTDATPPEDLRVTNETRDQAMDRAREADEDSEALRKERKAPAAKHGPAG